VTELPLGWAESTLGEIGLYLNGRGFKKSEWRENGRPIIRIQNLTGSANHFNYFDGEPEERYTAREGDLLVSWAATLGVFVWRGPEAVVNQHIFKVRSHIEQDFHRYMLLSVLDDLRRRTHGSGMVHITKGQFEATPVRLPPLAEQRRIVAAIEEQFSRLDAAGALLHRAAARLRRMQEAVYANAVTGSWPMARLGTLLREPLRNGHSAKASQDGTGVRSLTLSAVTYRDFSEKNTKLTIAAPTRVRGLWLVPGDVLIERSNTPELVGTAALFRGPRDWSIFPDLLIRVRPSDELLPEFLEIVLKARPTRRYFQQAAQGIAGSMPKIDQRDVENLEVPVPPLGEQTKIVAVMDKQLSIVDAMSAQIDRALRRSAALRRLILEHAFTGKLVPQDPSDEPASVLLERIAARRATAEKANGGRRSRRATMKT
jgi:type I restriction enzyme S subunit